MTGSHLLRVAAAVTVGAFAWLLLAAQAGPPPGWGSVGVQRGYRIETDATGGRGGTACVRLRGIAPEEGEWTGIGQVVDAAPWRGRRLRLSAWIRSEGMEEWGGLYLRIDGGAGEPAFGNNRRDPVRGTTGWRRYEVVLEVPEAARAVAFGVHLNGRGVLWADDFALEPVEAR